MNTITKRQNKKIFGAAGAAAALLLLGGIVAGPASADDYKARQSTQNNKNLMRNVGLAAGAAAIYEAVQGKGTNALLLGAGAALAGAQYEKDRKDQSNDHNWGRNDGDHRFGYDRRDSRYDRDDHRYGYDRRDDHRSDRYDNARWDTHHR